MTTGLPNDTQRTAIAEMIQAAFVEIRLRGCEGRGKQASDLADAFHNVAREMYGWGTWNPSVFKGMLKDYQDRYHKTDHTGKRDYLSMIEQVFPNKN